MSMSPHSVYTRVLWDIFSVTHFWDPPLRQFYFTLEDMRSEKFGSSVIADGKL
ncbi:MAG: hypothetical protein R2744_12160 [Bacteroidales bacterium]